MLQAYKKDFPIFKEYEQLVYLDHAATSQKPKQVVDAIVDYYVKNNGSPHRGAHFLSVKATELYDGARARLLDFLGADEGYEVIFTKNASEALNFVFYSYLDALIHEGDEMLISIDAHHSIIVPAQLLAKKKGAKLKYLYVAQDGSLDLKKVKKAITDKTVFVALPTQNNALGNIHDVRAITALAHEVGAKVLVDGSQSVSHAPSEVTEGDYDFFAFSSHKMYGPQGIGVLCAKKDLLDECVPFLTGGDTIEYVTEQTTTFAPHPERFEAGTQNVADVVGLMAAVDYMEAIGFEAIDQQEMELTQMAMKALSGIKGVKLLGPTAEKKRGAVVAFNLEGVHPHDVSSILDESGVAIRAGHHCAQPLMQHLEIPASCRASFGIYNTADDIDALVKGLLKVKEVFGIGD